MVAPHAGNFLHRFQATAHGTVAPVVEEGSCPDRGPVLPEVQEGFLQLPRRPWAKESRPHQSVLFTQSAVKVTRIEQC
jgi:hypothetical protein